MLEVVATAKAQMPAPTSAKRIHASQSRAGRSASKVARSADRGNATVAAATASHMATISMSARPGRRRPKKIGVQAALSASCTPKIPSAGRAARSPSRATSQAATPIDA